MNLLNIAKLWKQIGYFIGVVYIDRFLLQKILHAFLKILHPPPILQRSFDNCIELLLVFRGHSYCLEIIFGFESCGANVIYSNKQLYRTLQG